MPHEGSLLQTAVIFLLAAVLAVPLAKRLQLGAVLGTCSPVWSSARKHLA